jgi:hypothetical protein
VRESVRRNVHDGGALNVVLLEIEFVQLFPDAARVLPSTTVNSPCFLESSISMRAPALANACATARIAAFAEVAFGTSITSIPTRLGGS